MNVRLTYSSDKRAAVAAAVAVGLKMIGPAIPTKALIPLLTNLLRLLQAMAQIHMLNVSPSICH
jgi:hypothetical protein